MTAFFSHWLVGFVIWLVLGSEIEKLNLRLFWNSLIWPIVLPLAILRKVLS
jgi:hypothetical protein